MREVVVELEPPDNVAVAKIQVASASTRCVQMTVPPPLGISFEENAETGEIFVAEIARGSNADAAGVAKVGDVLRAASAMVPEMKYGQGTCFWRERAPGFQACAVHGTQRRRLQAGCIIRSNDRRRGQRLEGRELRRDARVGEKVAR